MRDIYFHTTNYKNEEVIKLYSWIAYDVFLTGLITFNWVVLKIQTVATALDSVEKFILFICTLAFAWYRIDNLRIDNRNKRIDIEEREFELNEKRRRRSA